MPKPKTKFQKHFWTIIFILINIVVIAWTAFSEFGNSDNAAKFSDIKINWPMFIPAILLFIIATFLEIYKYILMMKETCGKVDWKTARRTVLIGRYYDNITPAAVGGQPFQIYYMHKNANIPEGYATTIPIIGMISGQIGFFIIAVFAFLFGSFAINNAPLIATACFGLIFYAFFPSLVIIATFLPKGTSELVGIVIKFLAKIHIIKDKDKAIKETNQKINDYAKCVKTIFKTRGLFLKTILIAMALHLCFYSIPFFVLTALGGKVDFLTCLLTTFAVTSAVSFIPTPGNAGAAEGTFYMVFSSLTSGYVFWAMLIWRFFSFYIYIIMGALSYFFMHLENKGKENPLSIWWTSFKNFFKNLKTT